MSNNDHQYFLRRADEQDALCSRATHPDARAAHERLAAAYRSRAVQRES